MEKPKHEATLEEMGTALKKWIEESEEREVRDYYWNICMSEEDHQKFYGSGVICTMNDCATEDCNEEGKFCESMFADGTYQKKQ